MWDRTLTRSSARPLVGPPPCGKGPTFGPTFGSGFKPDADEPGPERLPAEPLLRPRGPHAGRLNCPTTKQRSWRRTHEKDQDHRTHLAGWRNSGIWRTGRG